MNRSQYPTRVLRQEEEKPFEQERNLSPAECFDMVWPLTMQAWEFATWNQPRGEDEPRLRRDVVRVIRDRG